jgi:hypothetical protein
MLNFQPDGQAFHMTAAGFLISAQLMRLCRLAGDFSMLSDCELPAARCR